MTNVRVRFSENIGVGIYQTASPHFVSLQVENAGRDAIYQAITAYPTYVGLALTSNAANRVTLEAGSLLQSRIWISTGIPSISTESRH